MLCPFHLTTYRRCMFYRSRDLTSQESGSHFDAQTSDSFWQNDTQLYFVQLSVSVESKEIFKNYHPQKT